MTTQDKIEALELLKKRVQTESKAWGILGLCREVDQIGKRGIFGVGLKYTLMREYLHELIAQEFKARGLNTAPYLWPVGKGRPRIKWIDNQIKLLQNGSKV